MVRVRVRVRVTVRVRVRASYCNADRFAYTRMRPSPVGGRRLARFGRVWAGLATS